MNTLIVGMVIFFGTHLVPVTPLKPALVGALGEKAYKGVFTVLSLVGLGLIIWGFGIARSGTDGTLMAYDPPAWGRHVTMLLVLLGFISLMASFHKGRLKLWLKQPMSIGVALWATGHLFANGIWPEVLLFGGFLAFALLDIVYSTATGRKPDENMQVKPVHDIIAVGGGVLLYVVFIFLHPYLIGVPVVS